MITLVQRTTTLFRTALFTSLYTTVPSYAKLLVTQLINSIAIFSTITPHCSLVNGQWLHFVRELDDVGNSSNGSLQNKAKSFTLAF